MPCREGGQSRFSERATLTNLFHTQEEAILGRYSPRSKADLVAIIDDIRRRGGGGKATGSIFSLSGAPFPDDYQIETRTGLNRHLSWPYPDPQIHLDSSRYRSGFDLPWLNGILRSDLTLPNNGRLIYIEAGMQLAQLVSDLVELNLGLPTMGSASSQTVAGAISTGTHGADAIVPPLGDFIRAIHLVSERGQEWWIEPGSHITRLDMLGTQPHWCPDCRVVYDDEAFRAALVSVGRFGVWYSVILEVRDQYLLRRVTDDRNYDDLRASLEESMRNGYHSRVGLLNDAFNDSPLRAFEAIYNPNRDTFRASRRWIVNERVGQPEIGGEGEGGITAGHFGDILANRNHPTLEAILLAAAQALDVIAGFKSAIPIAGPFIASRYRATAMRLRRLIVFVRRRRPTAAEVLSELFGILQRHNVREVRERVLEAVEGVIWNGRTLGEYSGLSHEVLDIGAQSEIDELPPPESHTGIAEGNGAEIHFDATSTNLLGFMDQLRSRMRASLPAANMFALRFSGRSQALIAMEQWDPTVAVEFGGLRPAARNFVRDMVNVGISLGGIPHWGQEHFQYSSEDLATLFGNSITRWRTVLAQIESFADDGVFSSEHSRQTGLEWRRFIERREINRFDWHSLEQSANSDTIVAVGHPHL